MADQPCFFFQRPDRIQVNQSSATTPPVQVLLALISSADLGALCEPAVCTSIRIVKDAMHVARVGEVLAYLH